MNDGARTRDNRNHNPDYNKQHNINQLVIRLPKLITNVNKSNKAMMILRTVAKSLHYLKTNLTSPLITIMEPLFFTKAFEAAKERGKIAIFKIKERQNLPIINHNLIVFLCMRHFLDWKNGPE